MLLTALALHQWPQALPDCTALQVLVSGSSDYQVTNGASRCLSMVERAKNLTATSVMFVPTLFWVSDYRAADATVNSQRSARTYTRTRTRTRTHARTWACTTAGLQTFQLPCRL